MKEALIHWLTRPVERLSEDEIEVRTWSFVVRAITIMVLGIAFGILYSIAFVPEDETLAPIDAVFLEILKAIAFMGVGAMGAISGRKGGGAKPKDEPNGQAA
jgi:uncharacterized RDD family membrane protein YckC